MLIDSEAVKTKLNQLNESYIKTGIKNGIPSYSVFEAIIDLVERETKEKEGNKYEYNNNKR